MTFPTLPPAVVPRVPVADLLQAGQVLHTALERAIVRLRLNGATWADIGYELGITRQGARQRWGYLDDLGDVVVMATGSVAAGTRKAVFWSTYLEEPLSLDQDRGLEDAREQLRVIDA